MVAPMLEVLLLRVLHRRTVPVDVVRPNRLVSAARPVDTLGYVTDGTSVVLRRPDQPLAVLPPGSTVWPPLLGATTATYAVLTHEPIAVWLRVGPFETLEGRTVHQVELELSVTLTTSPAVLERLLETLLETRGPAGAADAGALDDLGERLLERLAREVTTRTDEAVRRRTLRDLTGLSLGVLLDGALPTTFLDGALTRGALEVLDVDWPTEGRGWPRALAPDGVGGAPARSGR